MTDYALRLKKERERRLRMRSVVNLGISGQSGKRWAVTHSFLGVVLDRGSFSLPLPLPLGQGKFLQTRDLPKTTAWGYHPEGR